MSRGDDPSGSLDLFAAPPPPAMRDTADWPDPQRFPHNEGARVEAVVLEDLRASAEPLVITGYAGLDRILDFLSELPPDRPARILLGHEPYPSRRDQYRLRGMDLGTEIEHYWLAQGISLERSARLIVVIEGLRAGRFRAAILEGERSLHAKLYVGDRAVTLGSSNFSESGLRLQHEANVRFTLAAEPERYGQARQLAENYWARAEDYGPRLIGLLEQLLLPTQWQGTLARACAELLEGDWAEPWLRVGLFEDGATLWPSQRQGIAQALYVLSRQGSVLIADATGSGKTRLGVHLIGTTLADIVRSGRLRQGLAAMVCPPLVAPNWMREARRAAVPLDVISHGQLSQSRARDHEDTVDTLRRAQVLCVDEGHNFLNVSSNRAQHVLRNLADHVVLFTATPLNRSPADLLRIADMLGADNLDPRILRAFERMLGARHLTRALSEEEVGLLRKEIQRFTVRRTKPMLNALVERDPEAYVDGDGRPCRFPRHKACTYTLNESAKARETARRIEALADALLGVAHFRKAAEDGLEMPQALRRQGVSEQAWLDARLRSANRLSRHQVMSSLRSSRAALLEHLIGSRAAIERLGLEGFSKAVDSGNVIGTLQGIAGRCPKSRLAIELPPWLRDPEAHRAACAEDAGRYREILALVETLPEDRERAKAAQLSALTRRHALVLAFDARPITLAVIAGHLRAVRDDLDVVIATGDRSSDRERALEVFARGSAHRGAVGLCSDSLSEGVNLQQASALVHLDMPSVVRIAEQRVGRVDRLDSPHEAIEAWWPDDAPEFALTADERFLERYEAVDRLLGANMPLPERLAAGTTPVPVAEQIEAAERAERAAPWDGIEDAFAPVRALVEGEAALVSRSVYDAERAQRPYVHNQLSVVEAEAPWMFLCLHGGAFSAPRWLLLHGHDGAAVTELPAIAAALRARLHDETAERCLDEDGERLQTRFLGALARLERTLLPRRKVRALEELEAVIEGLLARAGLGTWTPVHDDLARLRALLLQQVPHRTPDWDELATRWLDLIRPTWFRALAQPRRRRPLVLRDLRETLIDQGDRLAERMAEVFGEIPELPPIEARVSACILGAPGGSAPAWQRRSVSDPG